MTVPFRRWLWALLLVLCTLPAFSQIADSLRPGPPDTLVTYSEAQLDAEEEALEGPDYGLGLMLLFFLVAAAVSAVALGILVLLAAAIVIVLTAWGVLTVSVLVGAYQKSFKKGFRVFWILGSAFATAFIGALLGLLVDLAFRTALPTESAALAGAGAGFLGGGLFGFGSFQLLQHLFSRIVAYFQQKKNKPV